MENIPLYLAMTAATLGAITILALAGLKAFDGWLAYRHAELASRHADTTQPASTASRIELADLKERLRKLEFIAAGVEL